MGEQLVERKKSLKLNMILNAIKGIMGIIFPLITFPYVSKILGVDNLGKYNFSQSIISYFILLGGLGISTYAIREGVQLKNDKLKFKMFADEMFSINLISTVVAYAILVVLIFLIPKLSDYRILLIILSLQIGFKTIGMEWIYSIFEDYAYITARSILFQFISLILLYTFVKNDQGVNIYATILVISSVGSNVLNYVHAKKYCCVSFTRKIDWKKHLKPIITLFGMSVTVIIYVSSDTTILGFICGDYSVGIYSVSVKIYVIVKTILSSVLIVSIPRLSALIGRRDIKGFEYVASEIYKTLMTILIPTVIGIIVLRKEIVLFISDYTFVVAIPSLVLLSIALIFCMCAWFWGQCILISFKKENIVLRATIASATLNICLNLVLIPIWKENAAAFTTLLAEGLAFIWCAYEGRKMVYLSGVGKTILKVFVGCIGIVVVAFVLKMLNLGSFLYMMLTVLISIAVYFIVEILLKNEVLLGSTKNFFLLRNKKNYN